MSQNTNNILTVEFTYDRHVLTLFHTRRSYDELLPCLVDEGEQFSDDDWNILGKVKTVEPVEEFAEGWRTVTLYQSREDPERVCLFFGDDEYEGLHPPYSFIDGVVKDGDGCVVEFVDPLVIDTGGGVDDELLHDPELEELEENGGGYLSNTDDDSDSDFLFGGDGDKKIVK